MREIKSRGNFWTLTPLRMVFLALVISVIVGNILVSAAGRNFFSSGNLLDVFSATSVLGIIALGQTLVLISGGVDLSMGVVASMSTLIAAGVMDNKQGNIGAGVGFALLFGVLFGLFNGILIGLFKINAFIATLGTSLLLSGYLATNFHGSYGQVPAAFHKIGSTNIGPMPLSTLIMWSGAVLFYVTLKQTRYGFHIFAVGGDTSVARLSGIRSIPVLIGVYVICSLSAAVAGLILASRTGVGSPTIGTDSKYTLLAIAAAILGGTTLSGGVGSIIGTISAVTFLGVISNVMSVIELNSFLQDVVRGSLIILAAALYAKKSSLRITPRFSRAKV